MKERKDFDVIDRKSLEDLVGTLDYLNTKINNDVKPIAEQIGQAHKVGISLNKLNTTLHSFNDDIAAKVKMGSANEIIVLLNEIADRVEYLGESLTGKYNLVLQLHQKELSKVIRENVRISQVFEEKLSGIIADSVRGISVSRVEKIVENEIKQRLGKFPLEKMDSLLQVSKLDGHLKSRIKTYDEYFLKIEQQTEKMKKIVEWSQEYVAINYIQYMAGALALGVLTGYTKFFYMFG